MNLFGCDIFNNRMRSACARWVLSGDRFGQRGSPTLGENKTRRVGSPTGVHYARRVMDMMIIVVGGGGIMIMMMMVVLLLSIHD